MSKSSSTNLTLSPAQLSALEADRLKLIVVPLEVQPEPQYVDFGIEPNALACFSADGEDVDLITFPYTTGDRIPTPHGNLIVTNVQVKQIKDITKAEGELTGFEQWEWGFSGETALDQFLEDFTTQHGPDAFDHNLWCAFVSVRKEQNDD